MDVRLKNLHSICCLQILIIDISFDTKQSFEIQQKTKQIDKKEEITQTTECS